LAEAQALTADEKAKLQTEYDQLQAEIAQWQKVLDDTRAKKNTIQGDVTALDAQIKKAETEIKQRNVTITTLGAEIQEKTKTSQRLRPSSTRGMSRWQNLFARKTRQKRCRSRSSRSPRRIFQSFLRR